MLPNLSRVIARFAQDVNLIKTTTQIIEHKPQETEEAIPIKAVIQVADKEKLKVDNLNYSLQYIQIHSTAELKIGDKVEYKGKKFRIIQVADYGDYGYIEAVGEEVRE